MLFLRGLIVALSGVIFIFLPGSAVALIHRRGITYERSLLLWGMAVLVVAFLPANFLISLGRQIALTGREAGPATPYFVALAGSLITALFVEGAKYLLLRWRKPAPEALLAGGVMVGLGVGLLTKVFQGFILLGAGIRLLFGDTSTAELAAIAAQGWPNLIVNLLALITDRVALVVVSAALGALVALAIRNGQLRWLWLAVAANAAFNWVYTAIGLSLGTDNLTANLLVVGYEGLLATLAFYWLGGQAEQWQRARAKPSRRAASRRT